MGRDSGYIAFECSIGGGAELVMVRETKTTINDVVKSLKSLRKTKTSSIVVVAEGDEEGGAAQIMEKVKGMINDKDKDLKVTTLNHIQRGGSPTGKDRILGSRCGLSAVEALMEGRTNCMAGIIHDSVVFTSFEDCIQKDKPLNPAYMKLQEILSI